MTDPATSTEAPKAPSLLRSSAIMASGTMVSRVLGLLRTVMLLAAIGSAAGGVSAAFQTANTLPNTVYNLLAAGVFDAVLVPQIVKFLKQKSGDVAVNRLITLAGTILFLVTVVALVISPLLVTLTAAAYTGEMRHLTILFSLLCLPQIFFYGLYNLLGELLNARGVFGPYMWAPVANNVIAIIGLGVFIALWGTSSSVRSVDSFTTTQFWVLAGSATLGVICQAAILVLPMRRAGIKLRPDFHFRGTSFGSASKVAGWTFATLGISQLGVLSTNNLAAQADAWASLHPETLIAGTAAYTTAFMIYMVPQSVISVSLATAIFTRLANSAADRDHRGVSTNYHLGVQLITMLSLLSAAIFIAAAFPMMQIVTLRSSLEIVPAYAWVLIALMPGVASTGMVLMSQRVFFAYEDAKPVFLMGIVPTILQVVVGWSIFFLASPKWWVVGAALGETVCRIIQGFIAVIWVARKNRWVNPGRIIASYLKYFLAALIGLGIGLVCIWIVGPLSDFNSLSVRILVSFLKLVVISVVVTVAFVGVLRLIDPAGSQRVLGPLGERLHLAGLLGRFMVRRKASEIMDGDNGTTTGRSGTGGAMTRGTDDEFDKPDETLDDEEPTADEREESEEATRTGWTMIARSWSASDPTHTGEFPAVRPLGSGAEEPARLPTFDEILHPNSAPGTSSEDDEGDLPPVPPPPAPTSADADVAEASTEAAPSEDSSLSFPPPPATDGFTSSDELTDPAEEAAIIDDVEIVSIPDEDDIEQPDADVADSVETDLDGDEDSRDTEDSIASEDDPDAGPLDGASSVEDDDTTDDDADGLSVTASGTALAGGSAAIAAGAAAATSGEARTSSWIHRAGKALSSLTHREQTPDADAATSDEAPATASTSDALPEPPAPSADDASSSTDADEVATTDAEQWIPAPEEHVAPPETWSEALHGEHEREIHRWQEHQPSSTDETASTDAFTASSTTATTIPAPPVDAGFSTPEPSGESDHPSADPVEDEDQPSDGHKHLNPTVPAVILGIILVIIGGIWAVKTVFSPLSSDPFSGLGQPSSSASPSDSQSGSTDEASPSEEATQASAPAPELQMPKVFPYKDGFDHPELATNMVDGDPETMWRSYEYDNNTFTEQNAVTILLPFKANSTVSEIDIQMDQGTSGGKLIVRKVDDPTNPRVGTELASSALSPNTVITLDQPTEASAISLEFMSMPTDSKGVNRAWISEIAVK